MLQFTSGCLVFSGILSTQLAAISVGLKSSSGIMQNGVGKEGRVKSQTEVNVVNWPRI